MLLKLSVILYSVLVLVKDVITTKNVCPAGRVNGPPVLGFEAVFKAYDALCAIVGVEPLVLKVSNMPSIVAVGVTMRLTPNEGLVCSGCGAGNNVYAVVSPGTTTHPVGVTPAAPPVGTTVDFIKANCVALFGNALANVRLVAAPLELSAPKATSITSPTAFKEPPRKKFGGSVFQVTPKTPLATSGELPTANWGGMLKPTDVNPPPVEGVDCIIFTVVLDAAALVNGLP